MAIRVLFLGASGASSHRISTRSLPAHGCFRAGYIGGSILDIILSRCDAHELIIKAYARSKRNAEKINTLGVEIVLGTLDDTALLEEQAMRSDIVVSSVRPALYLLNCAHRFPD
jgi:hypothetical protein